MLTEYFNERKNVHVGFIGAGISNLPIIKLFAKNGNRITLRAKKISEKDKEELKNYDIEIKEGEGYLDGIDEKILFLSPAVRPDLPQIKEAQSKGAVITCDTEEFYKLCPCPVIGITGSDGKTTTTTLISKITEICGKKTIVGGNIGKNLFSTLDNIGENDIAVTELSSFQLMKMTKSPHISVITNISPNHLDWHTNYDEYINAKKRILITAGPKDIVVLNYDCELTREFAKDAKCKVRFISAKEKSAYAYIGEDGIYLKGIMVLKDSEIKAVGKHNRYNYAAALAACDGAADLDFDKIRELAENFKGVEHRIEFVRNLNGINYYNSSIDSSPSRTAAALNSFNERVIVIAGGYDKNIPLDSLGELFLNKTFGCVLMGNTAKKIEDSLLKVCYPYPVLKADNMEDAVKKATALAKPSGTVILSPAAASFDKYKNFEERGNIFKEIVNSL